MSETILVTGGAGFIGSSLVRHLLATRPGAQIVTFDALTYAGHKESLDGLSDPARHKLVVGDIADDAAVAAAFDEIKPDAVINVAAETHVDQSNIDARPFVRTNALGTQVILEQTRRIGVPLVHVSTDEVYGSLPHPEKATTDSRINPTNPYAASKAAGDLMVLSAHKTHNQDVRITRCTNNYGPRQTPEKLIPIMTIKAMQGNALPVYGDGLQVRDWIYVDDHAAGIAATLASGSSGRIYHFTADEPRTNLDVVKTIIKHTDASDDLIEHVKDRPAHDRRYAMDDSVSRTELGWAPKVGFDEGLLLTVNWYRDNPVWCHAAASSDALKAFFAANYETRA